MRVCRLFYNTIRSMPLPEIYISPNLIRSVPRQVSVRRFIRIAGRNSGLVLQIRNIVRNSRWINAWIRLQERNHGWFFISDVWWRHSEDECFCLKKINYHMFPQFQMFYGPDILISFASAAQYKCSSFG